MLKIRDDHAARVDEIRKNLNTRPQWSKTDYDTFFERDIQLLLNLTGEALMYRHFRVVEAEIRAWPAWKRRVGGQIFGASFEPDEAGKLIESIRPFVEYAKAVGKDLPDSASCSLLFKQPDGRLANKPTVTLGDCRRLAAAVMELPMPKPKLKQEELPAAAAELLGAVKQAWKWDDDVCRRMGGGPALLDDFPSLRLKEVIEKYEGRI